MRVVEIKNMRKGFFKGNMHHKYDISLKDAFCIIDLAYANDVKLSKNLSRQIYDIKWFF